MKRVHAKNVLSSIMPPLMVFAFLALFLLSPSSLADNPGNGFEVGDNCGYVIGDAGLFEGNFVSFDEVPDEYQGCVDENGYFYSDLTNKSKAVYHDYHDSFGSYVGGDNPDLTVRSAEAVDYSFDFAWAEITGDVVVDVTTGEWSGYAKVIDIRTGREADARYLWFDWDCFDQIRQVDLCNAIDYQQRVRTDLNTGDVTGWAWNDMLGWVLFDGLEMELPPTTVSAYVDIFANDTNISPENVNFETAPYSGGYDYWEVQAQFYDEWGSPLPEEAINSISVEVTPDADSNMLLDMVHGERGDPILVEAANPSISECLASTESCMQQVGDEITYSTFVYSAAPTSNMIGTLDSTGTSIKYYADRKGCTNFYPDDPWAEEQCSRSNKDTMFKDRLNERNNYLVESVTVHVEFNMDYFGDREFALLAGDEVYEGGADFTFDYEPQEDERQLSFKPVFNPSTFNVTNTLTGEEYAYLPDYTVSAEGYELHMEGTIAGASQAMQDAHTLNPTATANKLDGVQLFYRTDVDTDTDSHSIHPYLNTFLLLEQKNSTVAEDFYLTDNAYTPGLADGGSHFEDYLDTSHIPGWGYDASDHECCFSRVRTVPEAEDVPDEPLDRLDLDDPLGGVGFKRSSSLLERIEPVLLADHGGSNGCVSNDDWISSWVACNDTRLNGCNAPANYCYDESDPAFRGPITRRREIDDPDYIPIPVYSERLPFRDTIVYENIDDGDAFSGGGKPLDKSMVLIFEPKVTHAFNDDPAPENTVSNPTVEQYACQELDGRFPGLKTCFFTAYLPTQDLRLVPNEVKLSGAINAAIGSSSFVEQSEEVSVLGNVNTITLRNKMFAQIARYTLGESAGGGTLRLNNTNPISGNISSLIGGRMAYAEGDVTVEGGGPNSSGFNDMILVVVGGNVTIKNNITNGRLGIIALKKNGVGGNVYIRNAVTDLHVNLFLDGTLFNSSGGFDEVTGAPLWTSILERTDSLSNQLYLRGSLVSRNTIAGSVDPSAGLWILGDGTTTTDYEIAREYDLNQFREFARCFDADPVTSQPIPGTNVACDQGESLSHHVENVDVLVRDSDPDEYYSPLIIEFEPPTAEMPIFTSETGIFR